MLMPSIFGENLFGDFMSDFPFFDDRDLSIEKAKCNRTWLFLRGV